MTTAATLMQIQDRLVPGSLPAGDAAIADLESAMFDAIRAAGIADRITPADLETLESRNYHTISRAATILYRQEGKA